MSLGGVAGGRITAGVGANLIGQHAHDRNQEATVYVGNLDPQVSFSECFYVTQQPHIIQVAALFG
jgi:hypothetical protein